MTKVIIGIVLPFLGTTLGSATVFFLKKEMNSKLQNLLRGFAAGVMIAASVWSLLIPSIDMAEAAGKTAAWLPAVVGFLIGIGFMLLLDSLIPHLHTNSARPEGRPSAMGKNLMLMLAVTLHNIPEGMAVGIVLAGMLNGNNAISASGAIALAVGIAIQNFPEGANNFSPPRRKRNPERQSLCLRNPLRCCRACRRNTDHPRNLSRNTRAALYPRFRRRCNDLCCHRRTYPRVPVR